MQECSKDYGGVFPFLVFLSSFEKHQKEMPGIMVWTQHLPLVWQQASTPSWFWKGLWGEATPHFHGTSPKHPLSWLVIWEDSKVGDIIRGFGEGKGRRGFALSNMAPSGCFLPSLCLCAVISEFKVLTDEHYIQQVGGDSSHFHLRHLTVVTAHRWEVRWEGGRQSRLGGQSWPRNFSHAKKRLRPLCWCLDSCTWDLHGEKNYPKQ